MPIVISPSWKLEILKYPSSDIYVVYVTSALIVQSHDDQGVSTPIIKGACVRLPGQFICIGSSPDGHAASLWVTDFVTNRQAIYKLIIISNQYVYPLLALPLKTQHFVCPKFRLWTHAWGIAAIVDLFWFCVTFSCFIYAITGGFKTKMCNSTRDPF